MKKILTDQGRRLLEELVRTRLLVAFDFDGTLAPIVEERDAAKMAPSTAALLAKVASRYSVAVISGRSRTDVAGRLGDADVRYVVGNHGLEPFADLRACAEDVARARRELAGVFDGVEGIDLEDKRYSLAVHYRRARSKADARARIERASAALVTPMRAIAGKSVVSLVPARAPNKADALVALVRAERADAAIYVGDDVTDEDVFRLAEREPLVAVRIGASTSTAATYFLERQRDIDRLLKALVALRSEEAALDAQRAVDAAGSSNPERARRRPRDA